jgi:hypothetical protein
MAMALTTTKVNATNFNKVRTTRWVNEIWVSAVNACRMACWLRCHGCVNPVSMANIACTVGDAGTVINDSWAAFNRSAKVGVVGVGIIHYLFSKISIHQELL